MRILVTGGAGFIGSHLVARLLDLGHDVICVDNCFTGSLDNLRQYQTKSSFTFVHHDVIDPLQPSQLNSANQGNSGFDPLDQIYHLACPASPVHYQFDPIKTLKTNILGTLNMLDLAVQTQARILLASTSEVYGDPTVHPQTEDYRGNVNPIGIRACYDEGKRAAETLMFDYHRQHHSEIRVARIFNTYGPQMQQNDGRVVSNFIMQALQGKPLTVYGDGSQTRSFCYVSDMVEGLIRFINSSEQGPINLGNPTEFTVLELAEKVLALVGGSAQIVYQPLPADDPTRRRPDITKAKTLLDWQPKVPLEEGLKLTITDFAQRLGLP